MYRYILYTKVYMSLKINKKIQYRIKLYRFFALNNLIRGSRFNKKQVFAVFFLIVLYFRIDTIKSKFEYHNVGYCKFKIKMINISEQFGKN